MTIHRPSNVDTREALTKIVDIINYIASKIKIIFPVHPRTQKNLKRVELLDKISQDNVILTEPIGYLEFLNLMSNAKFILTDSGGIQEEASYLKIPVLTIRENTERPITIEKGTNIIIKNDFNKLKRHIEQILSNSYKKGQEIEKWEGNTAKRIVKVIKRELYQKSKFLY